MVTFDICQGNPGCMQFLADAYRVDMFRAEANFQKMSDAGIRGSALYMLWNDCCGRNTDLALRAMEKFTTAELLQRINKEGGRGLPISEEEV